MAQPATPTTTHSTVGMTKEEKAAEMARRKEERKQVRSVFIIIEMSYGLRMLPPVAYSSFEGAEEERCGLEVIGTLRGGGWIHSL